MRKLLLTLAILAVTTSAHATTILSGSDTISFHSVTSEAAAAYKFLSNGGADAVLVINNFGAGPGYGAGGFGAFTSSPTLVGQDLSTYGGVMFASPSTCCSDPGAFAVGFEADLAAFLAAGGNLYIEDYQALPVWTAVLGFDGAAGVLVSMDCVDPGVATAQGASFGYVGGSFGCYTHQIYDPAFFAPLGFVSLVDNGNPSRPAGSVILGSGEAAVPAVPEPTTLALLIAGLVTGAGVRGVRRRKSTR